MAFRLTHGTGRRRQVLLALAVLVLLLHAWVTSGLAELMPDRGAAPAMPLRIEVAYVRELAPAAPPVVAPAAAAPAPVPARRARVPTPAEPAASAAEGAAALRAEPAPEPAAIEPPTAVSEPAPELQADLRAEAAPEPAPVEAAVAAPSAPATTVAAAPASAPASAVAGVAAAPSAPADAKPFEWPASTRLSYRLTGYFRGDVEGDAQVEWVRAGARYQVHLDFTIGPSMAPLITRRMSSDGEITAEGLAPRRFDQDTKIVFRDRARVTLLFEPDAVVLANGDRVPPTPGVQDTASQFVQLSYLFSTQPALLRSGSQIELPLALPRRIERWTYDVLEQDQLATPIGELAAFHLRPRRRPLAAPGDLVAEIWFAPTLRYLPVRIRIQQDAQTFVDLLIAKRPELAAQ